MTVLANEQGLFQDGDLIRVITREGVLIAAGGAASLLQTAHPKVAQGVYDHSYTADDPLRRLRNTMGWLYAVQFGTREEAETFSALVTKGHAAVTGPDYEANDPELQVWVAATLFAVAVQFYQMVFRRTFTDAELEEFYRQTKVYATILGCPEKRMPETYPRFREYYADMLRSLEITDASRAIAEQVLNPRLPGGPLHAPGLAAIRLLTAGLMPAPIREQYGWTWNARRERRFRLLVGTIALVYPRLPLRVRTLPREYYLLTTRRMLARLKRRPAVRVRGR
ncbi:oxygenase MpaB family protein [Actinomadura luteofluorescens]|uniref:oxygenase MpaB family protein n=1 Tax=Actinomadura luteofluorescens TaxID=46163 RepID=UPI003490FED3